MSFDELTKAFRADFDAEIGGPGYKHGDIARIPSGYFALDLMLAGGLPLGRFTEIFGAEGSAKTTLALKFIAHMQKLYPEKKNALLNLEGCVHEASRFLDVYTGQVHTAREIFEKKLPLSVRSYDTERGKTCIKQISSWFDNGVKPLLQITASSLELSLTENHKLWVAETLSGPSKWVRADEIKVGNYIASPIPDKNWVWAKIALVTNEQARFLGMMIGDGGFGGPGSPVFSNIDVDVIADMRGIVESWGGDLKTYDYRHHRLTKKGRGKGGDPGCNPATNFLKEIGLFGLTCSNKRAPEEIFLSTKEVACHFLAGLYLTDGHVNKGRPVLAFSNTSLVLIEQVQELWRRLGVKSTVHASKMYQEHHAQQYTVTINGVAELKKANKLLPLYGYKKTQLAIWSKHKEARCNIGAGLRFKAVMWSKVTGVEHTGTAQTYDFTINGTHNYTVNNVIAHNTYDEAWARKLGVDTDKLYVFEPDYGEACVDIVEGLLGSHECGIVVLDSLAALVSTREIGQSAEKSDVGGSGLLVGKLVRKVVRAMNTSRKLGGCSTFVAINQTRQKIGVMFGDPTSTPGGFAPKFAASLRLRLYGKDVKDPKVHKDLPVRKAISVGIKKYKMPVVATSGDMEIVLIPHKGYKTGDGYDFPLLKKYLEAHGMLEKRGTAWFFQGKEYKSLGEIKRLLEQDIKFGTKIKNQIIEAEKAKANGEASEGESFDIETGEITEDVPVKKKKVKK